MSEPNQTDSNHINHQDTCPSCNTELIGEYCHSCGEKKPGPHDLALKHFVKHSLHEFTHIEESKIISTISTLAFKPGKLTEDFIAGRRKLHISPLRIWLALFAIILFIYTFYAPMAFYDVRWIFRQDKSGVLENKIRNYAAKKQVDFEAHIDKINKRWQSFITYTRALDLFVFTGLLWLAFHSLRRQIPEHLIFSLHYSSFLFLFSILMWPVNLLFVRYFKIAPWPTAIVVVIISSLYLFSAMRRVYGQKAMPTALKAVILTIVYLVISQILFSISAIAAIITVHGW